MKIKHCINLHKALTFIFILSLMIIYNNFNIGALIYLELHGTYGILWLLKDKIYPDKQWETEISLPLGITLFFILGLYWIAPFILISSDKQPSEILIATAVSINIIGIFLHYSSDAQKYYTLKYHQGLITKGFFARCRNTNYLGEILIYFSFALLVNHWLPYIILLGFITILFIPNMLKKDQSLSRYAEFEKYKESSGLIFPKLFVNQVEK
ncbi:methyltransferase family protein [Geminocystis sp. CENA526]|uniref:methyltransferase family protein n=1 Tax=Geminocystis sp. CENA526 TaxID=1355871 RepID=UPI003D6FAE48